MFLNLCFISVLGAGTCGWDASFKNVHLNVEFFPPSCGVLFSEGGGGGEGDDGGVAV